MPQNEAARLEALRRYHVMDTEAEQSFDDITKLASFICGTPIAVVTLLDEKRQWFKSIVGLDAKETPREQAFCAHTILKEEVMVVPDAKKDSRFAENPLVLDGPKIRFYAGAPLMTSDGHALGALCVIDAVPREINPEQTATLQALARMVVSHLEMRRVSQDLAAALENVKTLAELIPICAYCKNVRDDDGYWQRVEAYIGSATNSEITHGICPTCSEKYFP